MFPANCAFASAGLEVGDGHRLYFEQCGNPQGLPVVVLHGGPGSGASERLRQLYDPALFHTILFDQRGAGRSRPHGERYANSSAELIADIERLRRHLGIGRWLVSGGSWGASLAIAYAASHPERCTGVLLRSLFLTGQGDLDWFFQGGRQHAPTAWQALADAVPGAEQGDMLAALQRQLEQPDPTGQQRAAHAWYRYEQQLSTAVPGSAAPGEAPDRAQLIRKYRLQAHYFRQHCFLGESRLLALAGQLAALPVALVHGRQDWVCRPANAGLLQAVLPALRLTWIDDCGHEPFHAGMAATWVGLLQRFAGQGNFNDGSSATA